MHSLFRFMRFRYSFVLFLIGSACAQGERVAVDVGHNFLSPGAISARGRTEFAFNLDLARHFPVALSIRGLRFVGINLDGDIGSLAERPRLAEQAGAKILLSVHHDSVSEPYLLEWEYEGMVRTHTEAKRGFGLFVSRRNPDWQASVSCASRMGEALRQRGFIPSSFHARKHEAADADNGVWFYDNLIVLYRATMPAVLLEAGVIKHRDEELTLLSGARQADMANALAQGIGECFAVARETPAQE